jgi:hypothetical protein
MTATVRQPATTEYGEPNRVESISAPLEFRMVRATDASGRRTDFLVCVLPQKDGLQPAVLLAATEKQMRDGGTMTKVPTFVENAVLRAIGKGSAVPVPAPSPDVSDALAASLGGETP